MNIELIKSKTLEAIKLVEAIIDIMQSYNIDSVYPTLQDLEVNPYYNQISEKSSLVVEEYYGLPSKVYTPLGYIKVCYRYTFINTKGTTKTQREIKNDVYKELKDKLNLRLYKEPEMMDIGLIGGWYTVGGQDFVYINQFDYGDAKKLFSKWLAEYISNKK